MHKLRKLWCRMFDHRFEGEEYTGSDTGEISHYATPRCACCKVLLDDFLDANLREWAKKRERRVWELKRQIEELEIDLQSYNEMIIEVKNEELRP